VLGKVELMKRGGPSVAVQGGIGDDFRVAAPENDPRFEGPQAAASQARTDATSELMAAPEH
jgi:hypothetical protein